MVELAAGQPGFLGVDSARGADGFGLTVSYWASPEAIAAWKADAEHQVARETGRTRWYSHYTLRVARVERSYAMPRSAAAIGAPAEVGLSGTFDTPGTSGTPVASRPPAD
jgi:heme-degrading monooxygenase HmoA